MLPYGTIGSPTGRAHCSPHGPSYDKRVGSILSDENGERHPGGGMDETYLRALPKGRPMTTPRNEPNRYLLTAGDIAQTSYSIDYTPRGSDGQPELTYSIRVRMTPTRTLGHFSGAEIRSQESDLGTLISVTLEAIPDVHTSTLTLLLPRSTWRGRPSGRLRPWRS